MIKIKKLFIVVICLIAVALSAMSCAYNDEQDIGNIGSESDTSHYQKITAYSLSANEKHLTFTNADDYERGMAEYIAKYESEEILYFVVKVDFTPDYDTKKLKVIEYIDKYNNDESCITYKVAPEKFNPELIASVCEDEKVISIGIHIANNPKKYET